jgi:glutamine synthetase adenylyltransferase
MAFADWSAFLAVLDAHRAIVSRCFEKSFPSPEEGTHPLAGVWDEDVDGDDDALERFCPNSASASRRRSSNACTASAKQSATCNCRRATASASTPSGRA